MLTLLGLAYSPAGGELWKVLCNRGLALFAIWVTTALSLQRKMLEENRIIAVQDRQKALIDAKILRGLLPICSSCKNIRDDKGYWRQIEIYIEMHSDALFSHGLCQTCEEKLYGGEEWFQKKRKRQEDSAKKTPKAD